MKKLFTLAIAVMVFGVTAASAQKTGQNTAAPAEAVSTNTSKSPSPAPSGHPSTTDSGACTTSPRWSTTSSSGP